MPIYEYECPCCGRFEVMQKASEKALKKDPECTRKDCPKCAERLVSAAAFQLKGTGWYKTDYASGKSTSEKSSSSSNGSSSSSSTDSAKSDKPAKSTKGGCGPGCGCH